MHQALGIPEILALVIGECEASPSTLARLARTCREFNVRSVDVLYGSTEVDLGDILRIPLEYGDSASSKVDHSKLLKSACETLSMDPKQWQRFDHLATKVKCLRVSFANIGDGIFFKLLAKSHLHSACDSNRPTLFPCLASLTISDLTASSSGSERPYTFALLPFLTTTLMKLQISITGSYDGTGHLPGLISLSSLMVDFCPNLKSLAVDCEDEGTMGKECEDFLRNMIRRYRNLKELTVSFPYMEPSTFSEIISLPHLEILKMHPDYEQFPVQLNLEGTCLSSLKVFHFVGDYDILRPFLEILDRPKLVDVSLATDFFVDMGDDTPEVKLFLEKLVDRTCSSSIRKLEVTFLSEYPVKFFGIAPLLAFKELQHLTLGRFFIDVSDADMCLLTQTFRQLRSLDLGHMQGLALQDLLPIARNCARLIEMTISVNAMETPVISETAYKDVVFSNVLKNFRVCDSPILDPVAVSGLLRTTFPSIRKLAWIPRFEARNSDTDKQEELWLQVSDIIFNKRME